jgi:hypothetical protein
MKKLLMILVAAGFLAASSGNLYANDNLPKPNKSKKVKQNKDGSTTTKKKEVKNDGSKVKKNKTSKSSY